MNRSPCKLSCAIWTLGVLLLFGCRCAASPGIDSLSVVSLYLELVAEETIIAQATGFVVSCDDRPYLITSWHVVTCRDPQTSEAFFKRIVGSDTIEVFADKLRIFHHGTSAFTWVARDESLYDCNGKRRWLQHPRGRWVDVVAFPVQSIDDQVQLYPLDLSLANTDMVPEIAMPISIIGFPLGLTGSGRLPIWKTGHIASEPQVDWKGEPVFLIDATTRGGMSGSPVVLRLWGGYQTRSGDIMMAGAGKRTLFLGVYSARLDGRSEIGMVWRPRVIAEILATAKRE